MLPSLGLGIDPLEQKLLGPRKARNLRKKQERDQIFAYQSQASRDGEDWSHVYDEVAAQVNAEGSAAHQLTAESAAAAHKLAEAEHRKLFRESPSLQKLSLMTPVATCPARARRRRESLSPTGEVPTREDSLAALEELSTLESRVVCDASESGSLPLPRTVNGTGHTGPSEFCATSI